MNSWKEKMFRKVTLYILCSGVLIMAGSPVIYAQEPMVIEEQSEEELTVIDEALDQFEKGLSPILPDDAELDNTDEVIEIPNIELEMAIPAEPAVSQEDISAEAPEGPSKAVEMSEPEPLEEIGEKIIPLMYAEASSLVEALNNMKSSSGEVAYNEDDRTLILRDTYELLEEMEALVREADILLETEIFKLEYVNAADIIENIKDVLTENVGQVHSDEEAESIVVTDTPANVGEIRKLVATLDRINKEVLIETKTLQIVLNDEHPAGVDWEAIVSDFQEQILFDLEAGLNAANEGKISLGTVSQEDYGILLEALDTIGVIQNTSEEDIQTRNEVETIARILKEMPLKLTVSIKRDQTIEALLRPELSKVSANMEGDSQEDVKVTIEDGATIVIGGLFEHTMIASTWKIPLLGDLPLLGFVFRNEGEESRKAEIMTFVTIKTAEEKENAEE